MNYKSRSYRIDDGVAEAIKKLPMSLNQFLRKLLSAGGAFESDKPQTYFDAARRELGQEVIQERANAIRDRKPLLKPSERKK